jgi:hypothetical protein
VSVSVSARERTRTCTHVYVHSQCCMSIVFRTSSALVPVPCTPNNPYGCTVPCLCQYHCTCMYLQLHHTVSSLYIQCTFCTRIVNMFCVLWFSLKKYQWNVNKIYSSFSLVLLHSIKNLFTESVHNEDKLSVFSFHRALTLVKCHSAPHVTRYYQ